MVKVIVAITTYNLEKYIAHALDSVLMQKTSFEFKIKVADDCSTDKTIEILESYRAHNPDKIEILYAEKNMGSLANSNRLLECIDCEYFSFLDGDDYWIDDHRLQRQVDFLETHREYSMCAGNTQYLKGGELKGMMLPKGMLGRRFDFKDLLNGKLSIVIHTSAILFRNTIFINGLPECYKSVLGTFEECALRGEDFRRIIHLEKGPIFIDNRVYSVYRIHDKGLWQGSTPTRRIIESSIGYNFYYKYYGLKYGDYFERVFKESYRELFCFLTSNSLLYNSDGLSCKEGELLSKLVYDVSSRNYKGRVFKPSRFRSLIFKFFIKS